jgi:hypothetical protein
MHPQEAELHPLHEERLIQALELVKGQEYDVTSLRHLIASEPALESV